MVANSHSLRGTPAPDERTLAACKAACVQNTGCVALDFNFNSHSSSPCYLHLNPASTLSTFPLSGVNQYRIFRCQPGQRSHFILTVPIPAYFVEMFLFALFEPKILTIMIIII